MPNRSHRFTSTLSRAAGFLFRLLRPYQANLGAAVSDSSPDHGAGNFEELRSLGWVCRFAPVEGAIAGHQSQQRSRETLGIFRAGIAERLCDRLAIAEL